MIKQHRISKVAYTTETLKEQPRFWLIYLGFLEKPRSLKELSKEYGYITKDGKPAPNLYQDKILDRMLKLEAVELKHFGKESKFLSRLDFLDLQKDLINILDKEWVRKNLFSLKNIKTFYNFNTCGNDLIKKDGNKFIPFVIGVLSFHNRIYKIEDNIKEGMFKVAKKKPKEMKEFIETQRKMNKLQKSLGLDKVYSGSITKPFDDVIDRFKTLLPFNIKGYIDKINPVLEEHEDEIKSHN